MSQSERVFRIATYLKSGRCLAPQALWREFATSPATIKRDIAHLRDSMHLPVVFDRARWGYRLDLEAESNGAEPPRLGLSAEELRVLLGTRALLASVNAGPMLAPQRDRLVGRLSHLLKIGTHGADDSAMRFDIQVGQSQDSSLPAFEAIANALLARKRLAIEVGTGNGSPAEHEVSPQRLLHADGHWYVEVFRHDTETSERLRVDTIVEAEVLSAAATDLSDGDGRDVTSNIGANNKPAADPH